MKNEEILDLIKNKDKPVLIVCSKRDCPIMVEDLKSEDYYREISELIGNIGGNAEYLDDLTFFMASASSAAANNRDEEDEISRLMEKFEITVSKSCRKYRELYVKFIFVIADKIGQKRLVEYEDKISKLSYGNHIDRLCVGYRLEGLSFPKIVKELVNQGHPPISWQAVQNRVNRFKDRL